MSEPCFYCGNSPAHPCKHRKAPEPYVPLADRVDHERFYHSKGGNKQPATKPNHRGKYNTDRR